MKKFESDSKEEAYFDRNQAVLLATVLAKRAGLEVGINFDDPKWPVIFIELPTGQVSWHIPVEELTFPSTISFLKKWDGHDLKEKRERIQKFLINGLTDKFKPVSEPDYHPYITREGKVIIKRG